MAPITSDCDAIRTHQHQMAVITSECDLGQMPGAMAELKANLTDDSPVREHLSSPPSVNTCHRVSSSTIVSSCAIVSSCVISSAMTHDDTMTHSENTCRVLNTFPWMRRH